MGRLGACPRPGASRRCTGGWRRAPNRPPRARPATRDPSRRCAARGHRRAPRPIPQAPGSRRCRPRRQAPRPRLGERPGQRAEAGADLDDPVARSHLRIRGDRTGQVRVDQEVLAERPLRADPVPLGEGPQLPGAERRAVAAVHARSVAGSETVRSRAEGPGSNVKGGAGWCPDGVSVGHDPHGREEFLGRIRGRRALAHLPRTREPARTRPRMSRRCRRKPRSRR